MPYHLRYYDKDGEQIAQTVDLKDRGTATDLYDRVCTDFDHDIGIDGAVTVELDDNGTVSWKHKRTPREPEVVTIPFTEPEPVKSTVAKKKS